MRRASLAVSAIGFSTNTLTPCSRQPTAMAECKKLGVAMLTASISVVREHVTKVRVHLRNVEAIRHELRPFAVDITDGDDLDIVYCLVIWHVSVHLVCGNRPDPDNPHP